MSKCTIAIDDYPVGVNRHGSGRGRTIQLWNGAPQKYGQYMEDVQADASVLGIDVESMHVRLLKVFYKFTAALTWLMYNKVIIPSN